MATNTLQEFLETYASGDAASRVTTIDIEESRQDGPLSPFIVVNYKANDGTVYTAVLNPMGLSDYLDIDVHPFVNGKDATAGAMGMGASAKGGRVGFDDGQSTSAGWPSAQLVAVFVGEQKHTPCARCSKVHDNSLHDHAYQAQS